MIFVFTYNYLYYSISQCTFEVLFSCSLSSSMSNTNLSASCGLLQYEALHSESTTFCHIFISFFFFNSCFICVYRVFSSHMHMLICSLCRKCQNPTEISQSIIARLSCILGVRNSGRVQINADHTNILP